MHVLCAQGQLSASANPSLMLQPMLSNELPCELLSLETMHRWILCEPLLGILFLRIIIILPSPPFLQLVFCCVTVSSAPSQGPQICGNWLCMMGSISHCVETRPSLCTVSLISCCLTLKIRSENQGTKFCYLLPSLPLPLPLSPSLSLPLPPSPSLSLSLPLSPSFSLSPFPRTVIAAKPQRLQRPSVKPYRMCELRLSISPPPPPPPPHCPLYHSTPVVTVVLSIETDDDIFARLWLNCTNY